MHRSSFGARAFFGVAEVVKFVYFFISFFFCFVSFFPFTHCTIRYFNFSPQFMFVFILFALNHFTLVTYFIKLLLFFLLTFMFLHFHSFCFSLALHLPRYYCLQCNFRRFAVRLYCFIFRINSHWRLFHLQRLLLLAFLFSLSLFFFAFRIHLTKCPLCPLSQTIHFLVLRKKILCSVCISFSVSFVPLLISTLHDWWVLYSQHSCHLPFFDVRFQHIYIIIIYIHSRPQ